MRHHVVIAGYPRSGTTLLYNMLRETVKGYQTFDREMKASEARRQAIQGCIISKRPTDVADAPELKRRYPDIQFILCIRDPRCVLVSEHDHARGYYKISWDKALKTNRRKGIMGTSPGLIERHYRVLQVPNPVVVYYEDLVRDPEMEQNKLSWLFGFRYTGSFLNVHNERPPERLALQLNGVRPPETSRIAAWREHPRRIQEQFAECPQLFDLLKFWGYESDDSWIEDL